MKYIHHLLILCGCRWDVGVSGKLKRVCTLFIQMMILLQGRNVTEAGIQVIKRSKTDFDTVGTYFLSPLLEILHPGSGSALDKYMVVTSDVTLGGYMK